MEENVRRGNGQEVYIDIDEKYLYTEIKDKHKLNPNAIVLNKINCK